MRDLQTGATSLLYSPNGIPAAGDAVPEVALNPVAVSDDGQTVVINGLRSGGLANPPDIQGYVIERSGPSLALVRSSAGVPFRQRVDVASPSADGNDLTFGTGDPAMPGSFIRSAGMPVVPTITPSALAPGSSGSLTLTGSDLVADTTDDLGPGITVDRVTVTDVRTVILDITVATDAATGPRTVLITGPSTGAGPGTGAVAGGLFTVT